MPHSMPCMQNQHITRIRQLDFDVFQDVLLDSTSMVYLPAPAAGFYIVYWFVLARKNVEIRVETSIAPRCQKLFL